MSHFEILIIEDDKKIREELSYYLKNIGYKTNTINDFQYILPYVRESSSNLILLDINLPFIDGYTLCREIRKESDIPIIIVTSRDSEMDELMSINLGADDFITKPYNLQILSARIEAILKRTYKNAATTILSCGDLKLDVAKGKIYYDGKEEILTKNELKILHFLILHRGKIVSREELMEYLWSSELFVDDNTLSVNMTRLRKKLEDIGLTNPIETRRGLGYVIL